MMKDLYELRFCGKLGKHVGCQQGCEEEYGTYACWECPDPNAPSHTLIRAHENAKKSKEAEKVMAITYILRCGNCGTTNRRRYLPQTFICDSCGERVLAEEYRAVED